MGQSAKSYISIFLNEGVELPKELSSKTAVEQAMLKHYYDTNPDAVGKPDITIVDYQNNENLEIWIELYSTRHQNLDFQVGLLLDYLVEFDDILEVSEDTWVQR